MVGLSDASEFQDGSFIGVLGLELLSRVGNL